MKRKIIKTIVDNLTKQSTKILQKDNKVQTKEKKNALDFKKGIYPYAKRETLVSESGEFQRAGSQTTDRALVEEHLFKVRDNLSMCNELEIISSYTEIPNK